MAGAGEVDVEEGLAEIVEVMDTGDIDGLGADGGAGGLPGGGLVEDGEGLGDGLVGDGETGEGVEEVGVGGGEAGDVVEGGYGAGGLGGVGGRGGGGAGVVLGAAADGDVFYGEAFFGGGEGVGDWMVFVSGNGFLSLLSAWEEGSFCLSLFFFCPFFLSLQRRRKD